MIKVYHLDKTEEWRRIVKSFKKYDAYSLPVYVQSFEIHGDGEPILLHYESAELKAFNIVIKRDIALDGNFDGKLPLRKYYDLTTPYGYGGFVFEGETSKGNLERMDQEYTSFCRTQGFISEFVRFHPVNDNSADLAQMYEIQEMGKTVTMKLHSQEQIWNDLDSKNRNTIRKAENAGIQVFWGRNPELIDHFMRLYNATMDKDNAKNYYYFNRKFFESILCDMKFNAQMFYAVYEERIVAMTIILSANKQMHYHLSGSDIQYQKLAPTNLMLFEAACWGAENGYETFHLGGGLGSKEDTLYKFKRVFNKHSNTTFSIGKKTFNEEVYNMLLHIRKQNGEPSLDLAFFPAYRAERVFQEN